MDFSFVYYRNLNFATKIQLPLLWKVRELYIPLWQELIILFYNYGELFAINPYYCRCLYFYISSMPEYRHLMPYLFYEHPLIQNSKLSLSLVFTRYNYSMLEFPIAVNLGPFTQSFVKEELYQKGGFIFSELLRKKLNSILQCENSDEELLEEICIRIDRETRTC